MSLCQTESEDVLPGSLHDALTVHITRLLITPVHALKQQMSQSVTCIRLYQKMGGILLLEFLL